MGTICATTKWSTSAPQVRLTATTSETGSTSTISYALEYIAPSAANTSVAKAYTVTINGSAVKSGTFNIDGKTGNHTICSGTYVVDKTTSQRNIVCSITFAFNLTWSGTYHGTLAASGNISVPAKTSYTIRYNANVGSGAPSAQTKWHDTPLTLSSTKPTRSGHTFLGWHPNASATTARYAAGATYTANASVTLYAVWNAITYTISYRANGGSGAPSDQTKTHGTNLALSTNVPTRSGYTFLGWNSSPTATTAQYTAGGTYTANASVTLYAVWVKSYVNPKIYNLSVTRCDSSGNPTDSGTRFRVRFEWGTHNTVSLAKVYWQKATSSAPDGSASLISYVSGTSGTVDAICADGNPVSVDSSYTVRVEVGDSGGTASASVTLNGAVFPIDFLAGGRGVSFGKPAELAGVADFGLDAKFNEPVYGKALGMDRLPEIPENSDFNQYMEPGCYAVYRNATAETCANMPVAVAGRLEVWSSTGEGVRGEQWSYLRQRFVPYGSGNAVWERDLARGENNVWTYYEWWRSSLTPIVSEKMYSRGAITLALSANTVLGVQNAYTKIPFDRSTFTNENKLQLIDGTVVVRANVGHVRVSGQVLVSCKSVGNRHVRIQRVSASGSVTSISWTCVYATINNNTAYVLTPMVVPVSFGDKLQMVFYTSDVNDSITSGGSANGIETYLTVEEF